MVGKKVGGVNVFGGGLAAYDNTGKLVGALGISGDTSGCDHNVCWKLRHELALDHVPGGVSPTGDDNIVNDFENGKSKGGWGHPELTPDCTKVA
jgi:hypothetical protein